MTYSQAVAELESILNSMRSDATDVDTLVERTKRASFLIKECRSRLTRTENELAKVLNELDNSIDA